MEFRSNYDLAMELSDGMFAYHVCGTLTAIHARKGLAPDPEEMAREYLEVFHATELATHDAVRARKEN